MTSTNLESQWRDRIVHNFSHAKSQHQDDQQFAVHGTQSHPKVGANKPKAKIKKLHFLKILLLHHFLRLNCKYLTKSTIRRPKLTLK